MTYIENRIALINNNYCVAIALVISSPNLIHDNRNNRASRLIPGDETILVLEIPSQDNYMATSRG